MFYHFTHDYAGLGLIGTLLLTIPINEIGATMPILSGILMVFGQGIRWYRDDKRKQRRHDIFCDIAQKMSDGKLPFDKEFLEKLNED